MRCARPGCIKPRPPDAGNCSTISSAAPTKPCPMSAWASTRRRPWRARSRRAQTNCGPAFRIFGCWTNDGRQAPGRIVMSYLIGRLLAALPVMAVVAVGGFGVMGVVGVVVFLLIHLSPGDPAALIAGDLATGEDIEKLRVALGLDLPLWQQFMVWFGKLVTGDLGVSIFSQVPVTQLLAQRLEPTLSIAALTMALTL